MTLLLNEFIELLKSQKRYSQYTVRNYKKAVEEWFAFINENGFESPIQTNRRLAKRYVAQLSNSLKTTTLRNKISAIRTFYKFLIQKQHTDSDPFSTVRLPKMKQDLPVFLTENQTPQLLQAPWDEQPDEQHLLQTLRDALCLELLYGAGLRISELCSLKWKNIDFSRNAATVVGKGNKTRFCPFGENAGNLLRQWKSQFALSTDNDAFILHTPQNKPMYPRFVQRALAKYLSSTNLPSNITPHKLRHSFATHLVNEGVDLRALQEMLGHASLSTTQIYTHLNTKKLVAEHRAAHPRTR
ncbi:MAG: tyrosine recombinase XerC [Verrucomicrobiaceae bacterium]|nr:tyrosine recombinase XerC [Verrucomicrobiaceae bacterium]